MDFYCNFWGKKMSSCLSCGFSSLFIEENSSLTFCSETCQTQYHHVGLKVYKHTSNGPVLIRDNPVIVEIRKFDLAYFETLKAMNIENTDEPIRINVSGKALKFIVTYMESESEVPVSNSIDAIEIFYAVHYLGYTGLIDETVEHDDAILYSITELSSNDFIKWYNLFLKTYLQKIIEATTIRNDHFKRCVQNNNINLLQIFFQFRGDIKINDKFNILLTLVNLNHFDTFKSFVDAFNDINLGQDNQKLLLSAVQKNAVESVEVLIMTNNRNIDVTVNNFYVIRKMIKYGSLKLVKMLYQSSLSCEKLFKTAAKYNQVYIFDFLFLQLEDIKNKTKRIQYGFKSAVKYNRMDMFLRLSQFKDYLNFRSYLEFCGLYGRLDMLKELLASIERKNTDKINDVFVVAASNGHLNILQYLLETFTDVNFDRALAIKRANENGYSMVENYLLESSVKKIKR
jgi:hypothetical protein